MSPASVDDPVPWDVLSLASPTKTFCGHGRRWPRGGLASISPVRGIFAERETLQEAAGREEIIRNFSSLPLRPGWPPWGGGGPQTGKQREHRSAALPLAPPVLLPQRRRSPCSASQTAGPTSPRGPLTASSARRAQQAGKAGEQEEDLLGRAVFAVWK